MTQFRKLPVVIEAVQFTGDNWNEITAFFGRKSGETRHGGHPEPGDWQSHGRSVRIVTLEGIMTADEGDWIIKGIKGEFYPCKPDIFAKTYEEVA